MEYKLIAVDLDRTLLHSDNTISPYTREVIAGCIKAGVGFTFATGRMYNSCRPFAQQLGLMLPLITYQGALLKDVEGRIMHQQNLPAELAAELHGYLVRSGLHYNIYEDEHLYLSAFHQQAVDYARHIGIEPQLVPIDVRRLTVTEFGVMGEPLEICQLQEELRRQFGQEIAMTTNSGRFLEICHGQVSKGAGLAWLAEYCQVLPEQIIAIGDDQNDLSMLKYAGLGAAVSNAIDEAKAAAGRVIGSNDEDGVAHFLAKVILQGN